MNEENRGAPLAPYEFESNMSRVRRVLGWIYLPVHILVLPVLISLLVTFSPAGLSDADGNLIYYLVSTAFVLAVMYDFLRRDFDVLLDGPVRCLIVLVSSILLAYILSFAAGLIMLALGEVEENPNDQAIGVIMGTGAGKMIAVGVFLAPIVEEVLFRGVVFGSIRRKNRILAYVVSIAIFAINHVWPYAAASMDAAVLVYALQYIPLSYVLTRAYERSGSIWISIFFHMGYNALAFRLLSQ